MHYMASAFMGLEVGHGNFWALNWKRLGTNGLCYVT